MALDVAGAAAAIDDGQLLVVLAQLGEHRLAVGAERRRGRKHPIGKDAHGADPLAHRGRRFSANAAIPSRPSSLVNSDSDKACRSASVRVERSSVLVAATAFGPPARIPRHNSATVAPTSSADVGDETHVERSCGVERLAGEVRAGQLRPSAALQDRRGDDRRGDADAYFGERERDRRIDHDEVARCHQPDTAGPHRAVDRGDDRSRHRSQTLDGSNERRRVDHTCRAFLQVGAGAERRGRVGEHDDAGGVTFCRVEGSVQIGEELLRQGVAVARRVERDRGYPVRALDVDQQRHIGDCNRLRRDLPKERLDIATFPGAAHRRQRVDDLPAVAGLAEPGIEHGDDAAVGRVADQPTRGLGEQHRRPWQVDLAEGRRTQQFAAGGQQRIVGSRERECGRW